jgi:tetratricopeptide (TPR) repeat protein
VTSSLLGIVAGYEDELDVEDALDELMSWNFVTREGSILVDMHDMVQSYAETVLFGSEMPNYQPTIASVQRYVVGHAQDFDSLQLDQPNILGAAKAADDETCASIIRVLALDGYFDARGHTMDFLLLLDKVLKYFRVRKNEETLNSDQLEILHYLLAKRGTAYFHRGDYENAAKIYKESLQLTDEVSRTVLLSGVTGKALSFQGNYDEAEKYFEEGKKVAEEAKDDFLLSFILDQEALAAGEKEDHDTVRHIVAKQVVINERLLATNQDPSQKIPLLEALIFSLVNLGTAEIMLAVQQQPATDNAVVHKQIQSAQAIFKRAEQIAITIDNSFLQANVLHALAESYHFLDEREKAQDLFEEARTLYSSRGAVSREKLIVTFMHLHGYPVMSDAVAAEGK